MAHRTVFFVSDQTGVTAETVGHSLLTQFDGVEFSQVTLPFVDTLDKARKVAEKIDRVGREEGLRPIVFVSIIQDEVRAPLMACDALVLDFFQAFLAPLEAELEAKSSHTLGRAHGMFDTKGYNLRIDATNFAMAADDGHASPTTYRQADLILIGVSRSGKTPTCLYLALQYGVFAANYPLAEEDLESGELPASLEPYRRKLYGLTISPERLRQIRLERRSVGRYASTQQVSYELRAAEALFKRYAVPYIDTTHSSIEEIASTILDQTGVERRVRS
ncbi:MAG TPA: pyruvate, water dikinase regulatory protein [Gammaproteobacteria bacterium]|nr:pyruvate, water dikinase regulatory protein [Gammaproteobacteria bacterium]